MIKNASVIDVHDLVVTRGHVRAVTGSASRCIRGKVTGLLGPSGCGKTTLMRSMVGVQVVTSGTVEVLGLPAGDKRLRDRVGYVTQAPSVYDDLTVAENVRFFARVLGAAPATRWTACIEAVDLGRSRDQVVSRLSGGQRSRVSLAVALLGAPRCWCSTSRPSASTRCCAATSGRVPRAGRRRRRRARVQPRDGRGRALRPAAADARRAAARRRRPRRSCCERTGAADVEGAFLALVDGEAAA